MGDGSVPAGRGVVPSQLAEIIVALDGGPGRRGSGYRVGPTSVLTAAHVIEGAVAVRVRFDADLPGEWTAEVISCWAVLRSDLAVLTIAPREGETPVAVARFGRIGEDQGAMLPTRVVGFPRFKLRSDHDAAGLPYRDSHQADGSVAVLSNRREGTLEITVTPPERDPDPSVSPWEGMSGAAVWIGDRIVGVIAKHHRADGLGRLAAARLDLALERLDQGRRAKLRILLRLPDVLPDVVPSKDRAGGDTWGGRRVRTTVGLAAAAIGLLTAVGFLILLWYEPTPPNSPEVVAYNFDQGISTDAQANRYVTDSTGHGHVGYLKTNQTGDLTVIDRPGQEKAVHFPAPCMPTPTTTCPLALIQTAQADDLNPGTRDFSYGADVLMTSAP